MDRLARGDVKYWFVIDVANSLAPQEIPQHFILKYAEHLGESVTLRVPNSDLWILQTGKRERWEGRVWLGRGWKNFIGYCSVLPEYLVQFLLDGNSTFDVVIFDQKQSEVEYPTRTEQPNDGFLSPKREEADDDASIQIFD
ncbi:hypothetical protein CRG98_037548 [Punica granatum]|uniref:TF-B3 domain-containing protein n=1 Tax=Punica granatum TaxID=22663 RepID=A0A2I0IDM5_PUNGR|nr:hypothetical protein CRG98_037548 [Punica granatum]